MHCIVIISGFTYHLATIQKQKESQEIKEDVLNLTGQPLGCSFTLDADDSLLDENFQRFCRRR